MSATTTQERNHATMSKSFISTPGDVYSVVSHEGCISDTIELRVDNENTGESFTIGLPNRIRAWKLLKQLDEIPARKTVIEHHEWSGSVTVTPYKESIPYKHRFPA